MTFQGILTSLFLAAAIPGYAQETLRYSVNWPSGLSLGEAALQSHAVAQGKDAPSRREHSFTLDASVPGFAVVDRYRSLATSAQCSIEFEKNIQHGQRKTIETTTFKPDEGIATRKTKDGGKTDFQIAGCAKDGLAYLYWLRSELAQGRLPAGNQKIFFGAPYEISVQFGGKQDVTISDHKTPADRLVAKLKGPASETSFEMFFSDDAAKRLLMVRVPLAIGSFSMELVE
jgi:hypothetical protein